MRVSTIMAFENLMSETETAVGPTGLKEVLNLLLNKAKFDPSFAANDHYILYMLGDQESLIKADMSQKPFQFWYYDLLGRPATPNVVKTIDAFLAENGDAHDIFHQFHDLYLKEREAKISASINGESLPLPEDPKAHAYKLLSQEKRTSLTNPKVSQIGMFSFGEKKPLDQKVIDQSDQSYSSSKNKTKP